MFLQFPVYHFQKYSLVVFQIISRLLLKFVKNKLLRLPLKSGDENVR